MQRRSFVRASVGSLLAPTLVFGCQRPTPTEDETESVRMTAKLDKFGLQLSTVTKLMLEDFEGTLSKVAQIGYQQVEFSAMGFLGRTTEQVQRLLTEFNLEAPVGRITPALPPGFLELPRDEAMKIYRQRGGLEFLLENVAHSLDSALALGQRNLVLPALMPDNFQNLDQVKRNIELMNKAGDLCAKQGVTFGYHNHSWELAPLDGAIPYDLMLQQTNPETVNFQLDAYWITKGGGDLFAYLERFPGRFTTCHMKDIDDQGNFADVGDGLIDFPTFTREALAQGAQYFFVERDNPPDPASSIQRSFTYLQQMTF